MDEDKDRCRLAFVALNVELLDLGRSVGEALGLADSQAHQFAVANTTLDQLLAVRRIGGLIISRVKRGLIVVKEYRRPFFGHRTPSIRAGFGDWLRPKERKREALHILLLPGEPSAPASLVRRGV